MKVKLFICTVLLTHYSLIVSMDDEQLIALDPKPSIDLKKEITLNLNGASNVVSTKVLESINKRTREDKTVDLHDVARDLKRLEKSQTLSRTQVAIDFFLNMANTAWLASPTVMRMSSSEDAHVCFMDSMNPVVPFVELINCFACICSLYLLLQATGPYGGCSTSKKLSLNLRRSLKNKQANDDVVTVQDLHSIISSEDFRFVRQRGLFAQAAMFAELSNNTIDVGAFKRFLPRSYAMPDILRFFMAFAFVANIFPSFFCTPGVWTTEGSGSEVDSKAGLVMLGLALYMFNAVEAMILCMGHGASKKLADIRKVTNTIQDHLQQERSVDNQV